MIAAKTPRALRKDTRIRKIARLTAYCVAVGLFSAGLALGSAYGGVKDSALELGSELGKLDGAGSQRPIRLNGEPIFVSSAVADVPVGELLDRVEERCMKDPAGIVDALPRLPEATRRTLRERLTSRVASGIMRQEKGSRGVVACFMRSDKTPEGGAGSRLAAVSRFIETGDLIHLGGLRYVFAEKTDSGRTHVVTAWTDGSFNLYNLLAAGGDAPGSDLPGVPRPEGSIRMLTASIDGVPYSFRVYRAPGGPEPILARYDAEMEQRGWERMMTGPASDVRVYRRAGLHVYVMPKIEDERTLVTVLQMHGDEVH